MVRSLGRDLEPMSLANAIAAHAWERHAPDFRHLHPPLAGEAELAVFIDEILETVVPKPLRRGRQAYLHEPTGTVVITEPNEAGTALIPADPDGYYERLG